MRREIEATIKGKTVTVESEGITPIELNTVLERIESEMRQYEQKKTVPDTIKQLIYVAVKYGIQLYKKDQEEFSLKAEYERKIEEFIEKIKTSADDEKLF
ncbi:MAG: cell division protein ZapA [Elusimicrobia bacterium]|nr:cell division protein ZapA [Elusimicrobiota bacterium]